MKEIVLVLMLVGLVVLSGIQAVQISDLKSDIQEGNLVTGSAVVNTGSPPRTVSAPAQPSMVGGC